MSATMHTPAECVRLRGPHLQYHGRNWSDAFECPTCKRRKRLNLNFLGSKAVTCDGSERWRKVARWEARTS